MTETTIRVRDLVKDFEIYERPQDIALEVLLRRPRHRTFRALDNVSFEVEKGEVLGIIGANGAGKSTLLKIMAGVLDVTKGAVELNGRVTAILELGLGFNPEYSGKDNVYLSGLLYGMEREEIDVKLQSIIDFSGLREFINQPVKTYSSGMHSRLAFSIATAVDPDILIIDEALAAGDGMFVQKCFQRIRELCDGGRTVLMVSHGTGQLAQLCRRIIWLDKGRIRMEGRALEVVQAYDLMNHQAADEKSWIDVVDDSLGTAGTRHKDLFRFASSSQLGKQVFRRGPIFIERVQVFDSEGTPTNQLGVLKPFSLRISYRTEGDLPTKTLGVAIAFNQALDLAPALQWYTQNVRPDETPETYDWSSTRFRPASSGVIELNFAYMPLRAGDYLLSVGLLPNEPGTWEFYEYRHFFYLLQVVDGGFGLGAPVFFEPASVRHEALSSANSSLENLPAESVSFPPRIRKTLRDEIHEICVINGGYPSAWPYHKECPACGNNSLVGAFKKYNFSHSRCRACEFIFVNPYPPEHIVKSLYEGNYYTGIRELFELPRVRNGLESTPFTAPRDLLEKSIDRTVSNREEGSWLDVGGGIGSFAAMVKKRHPQWSVALNELNSSSIRIAREIYGLDIITSNLTELAAKGTRFDVISSVSVLEHTPEPRVYVESCVSLLKPGGRLLLIVPNFSALNSLVSKGSSPNVVPPFHLSLFNSSNLMRMLDRVGEGANIEIEEFGAPCFSLIQCLDYGDRWDITVPSSTDPEPRSVPVGPSSKFEQQAMASLASADQVLSDYFGNSDGRQYLAVYFSKKTSR